MATTQIKNGFDGGSDDQLLVNPDGSIDVKVVGGGTNQNVDIHDSSGNNLTSTSGSLNVNITGSMAGGTPVSLYNEVTGIAMNASSTVITYTVPPGTTFSLESVSMSSDSISTAELDVNGTANAKQRISYGFYNLLFEYNSLPLVAGTVINLVATNNSLQGAASFNATLQGTLS
jgi:hypothetical protein